MTFVEGFYSFNLDLTDVDTGVYTALRVKTPRHPYESLEYLGGRVLAYTHSYRAGHEFSRGMFEIKEPTIWARDAIGTLTFWAQVGCPEQDKIQRALRHNPDAEFRVYFHEPAQVEQFCHMLRGSKTNWVGQVKFYLLDQSLLAELAPLIGSRSNWRITIVDSVLYLVTEEREFETSVETIDIWARYQETIANAK